MNPPTPALHVGQEFDVRILGDYVQHMRVDSMLEPGAYAVTVLDVTYKPKPKRWVIYSRYRLSSHWVRSGREFDANIEDGLENAMRAADGLSQRFGSVYAVALEDA